MHALQTEVLEANQTVNEQLLSLLMTLLITVVIPYVIIWGRKQLLTLREKTKAELTLEQYSVLMTVVKQSVLAAEQVLKSPEVAKAGEVKRERVFNDVNKRLGELGVTTTAAEIYKAIEAAVWENINKDKLEPIVSAPEGGSTTEPYYVMDDTGSVHWFDPVTGQSIERLTPPPAGTPVKPVGTLKGSQGTKENIKTFDPAAGEARPIGVAAQDLRAGDALAMYPGSSMVYPYQAELQKPVGILHGSVYPDVYLSPTTPGAVIVAPSEPELGMPAVDHEAGAVRLDLPCGMHCVDPDYCFLTRECLKTKIKE